MRGSHMMSMLGDAEAYLAEAAAQPCLCDLSHLGLLGTKVLLLNHPQRMVLHDHGKGSLSMESVNALTFSSPFSHRPSCKLACNSQNAHSRWGRTELQPLRLLHPVSSNAAVPSVQRRPKNLAARPVPRCLTGRYSLPDRQKHVH